MALYLGSNRKKVNNVGATSWKVKVKMPDEVVINHSGTIPEGGTYYIGVTSTKVGDYTGATTTLSTGDAFPETLTTGDVYVYGDYEYRYEKRLSILFTKWETSSSVSEVWGVSVLDKTKTEYGEIANSINGKLIGSLQKTFYGCSNMLAAPAIPNGVKGMANTFYGCLVLEAPPIIPEGVTGMTATFYNCKAMKEPPNVPQAVQSLTQAFYRCLSLTSTPDLSNNTNITAMKEAFIYCTGITDISKAIPPNVINLNSAFKSTSVADISGLVIPASVTDLSNTFQYTDIVDISGLVIPEGVTSLGGTFNSTPVEKIDGLIIPSTVTNMTATFAHCNNLANVTGLVIPASVYYMTETFFSCDNLTGVIQINSETIGSGSASAFKNTLQPITLTGTGTAANATVLETLAAGANNGNVTIA